MDMVPQTSAQRRQQRIDDRRRHTQRHELEEVGGDDATKLHAPARKQHHRPPRDINVPVVEAPCPTGACFAAAQTAFLDRS